MTNVIKGGADDPMSNMVALENHLRKEKSKFIQSRNKLSKPVVQPELDSCKDIVSDKKFVECNPSIPNECPWPSMIDPKEHFYLKKQPGQTHRIRCVPEELMVKGGDLKDPSHPSYVEKKLSETEELNKITAAIYAKLESLNKLGLWVTKAPCKAIISDGVDDTERCKAMKFDTDLFPLRCLSTEEGVKQNILSDAQKNEFEIRNLACTNNPNEYMLKLNRSMTRIEYLRRTFRKHVEQAMTIPNFTKKFDTISNNSDIKNPITGEPYSWGVDVDSTITKKLREDVKKMVEEYHSCTDAMNKIKKHNIKFRGGGKKTGAAAAADVVTDDYDDLVGGGTEMDSWSILNTTLKILNDLIIEEHKMTKDFVMWKHLYKTSLDNIKKDEKCNAKNKSYTNLYNQCVEIGAFDDLSSDDESDFHQMKCTEVGNDVWAYMDNKDKTWTCDGFDTEGNAIGFRWLTDVVLRQTRDKYKEMKMRSCSSNIRKKLKTYKENHKKALLKVDKINENIRIHYPSVYGSLYVDTFNKAVHRDAITNKLKSVDMTGVIKSAVVDAISELKSGGDLVSIGSAPVQSTNIRPSSNYAPLQGGGGLDDGDLLGAQSLLERTSSKSSNLNTDIERLAIISSYDGKINHEKISDVVSDLKKKRVIFDLLIQLVQSESNPPLVTSIKSILKNIIGGSQQFPLEEGIVNHLQSENDINKYITFENITTSTLKCCTHMAIMSEDVIRFLLNRYTFDDFNRINSIFKNYNKDLQTFRKEHLEQGGGEVKDLVEASAKLASSILNYHIQFDVELRKAIENTYAMKNPSVQRSISSSLTDLIDHYHNYHAAVGGQYRLHEKPAVLDSLVYLSTGGDVSDDEREEEKQHTPGTEFEQLHRFPVKGPENSIPNEGKIMQLGTLDGVLNPKGRHRDVYERLDIHVVTRLLVWLMTASEEQKQLAEKELKRYNRNKKNTNTVIYHIKQLLMYHRSPPADILHRFGVPSKLRLLQPINAIMNVDYTKQSLREDEDDTFIIVNEHNVIVWPPNPWNCF